MLTEKTHSENTEFLPLNGDDIKGWMASFMLPGSGQIQEQERHDKTPAHPGGYILHSQIPLATVPEDPREIEHELCNLLGETTNVLIYALLDNRNGDRFTRDDIRKAIEDHKTYRQEKGRSSQHLARLRIGKATVNYWIDRLVENESIKKKHSNPVVFWIERSDTTKPRWRI